MSRQWEVALVLVLGNCFILPDLIAVKNRIREQEEGSIIRWYPVTLQIAQALGTRILRPVTNTETITDVYYIYTFIATAIDVTAVV